MAEKEAIDSPFWDFHEKPHPPGKAKIMAALRTLLGEKEFVSITISDIARNAGVTEALIYKYFKDKRDLLHQVLAEYLNFYITGTENEVRAIKGPLNQLRKLIWSHINMYDSNRVFARILLLEVRNYADYFLSDAYQMVKRYTDFLLAVIEEGMKDGSIRRDIPAVAIRQLILGGIEHACLPATIFSRSIDPDKTAGNLCAIILEGITPRSQPAKG
jgi:TetR/AcrR family transcriptional regulator, fatty acid metabolism regulator protein